LSYGLDFSPDAEEDLRSAYLWYESKRTGLGEEFLCCVEAALALVRDNPFLGRKVHERARRIHTRRFPYGILYGVEPRRIVVFSVFHGHRDPTDWLRRVS
jgi:plasmid stabilization system protein ParE